MLEIYGIEVYAWYMPEPLVKIKTLKALGFVGSQISGLLRYVRRLFIPDVCRLP